MDETLEVLALWPRVPAGLRFRRGREEYLPVDFCHDLERVLDALGGRERRRVRLVYLIDEIDALEAGSLQLAHARLAPLLSPRTDELRVVLAGVGPSARESTGTNAHDGSLATLELEPLAPCDAEALVREPVAGVYAYADTAVDCILEASRLRPFVIQRLCRRAVDRMLDDGRSTVLESDVVAGPVDAGALV
jgi:hypothetical protein